MSRVQYGTMLAVALKSLQMQIIRTILSNALTRPQPLYRTFQPFCKIELLASALKILHPCGQPLIHTHASQHTSALHAPWPIHRLNDVLVHVVFAEWMQRPRDASHLHEASHTDLVLHGCAEVAPCVVARAILITQVSTSCPCHRCSFAI